MSRASVLSCIIDSRKPGSLWEMIRGVGGVRKSIHQSWLTKGLGLLLLCCGFKGVQEEIPSEKASTLQIGWLAFPPGQCTSPQIVTDYLTQMSINTIPQVPYSPDLVPCDFWLFPKPRGCHCETIEEMKEAVTKVIDKLTHEDFHGPCRSFWISTRSALQPEVTSEGSSVSCLYYQ